MAWLEFMNRAGASRPKEHQPIRDNAKPKDGASKKAFKNDPDDPTNPNEVREQHLRNLHHH